MTTIVCTESVVYSQRLFSQLGHLIIIPDEELTTEQLKQADILITRSQIKITQDLIANTPLKFIGTATSGTDHISPWVLAQPELMIADAKGSNAESVCEYVLQAILLWLENSPEKKQYVLGIIGYGCVGQLLAEKAKLLGFKILINDPPLFERGQLSEHVELKTLAQEADIISLHVPLTQNTQFPTFHLLNEVFFEACQRRPLLINTARGEVLDFSALEKALAQEKISKAVIDVWPQEPRINPAQVKLAWLATPHIAGHSFLGKLKGSFYIYQALCQFLGTSPVCSWQSLLAELPSKKLSFPFKKKAYKVLANLFRQAYDLQKDVNSMQNFMLNKPEEINIQFSNYRKNYPIRDEFAQCEIEKNLLPQLWIDLLTQLGFRLI